MPAPRVFISSTCYDLKYIRENLKFFIRTLGYEPILSEEGSVFYDPTLHVQDACLAEVPACQMFVLIIGGRYGGRYKTTDKSITNAEYEEAVRSKVPIFAMIEQGVYDDFRLYTSNKGNPDIDATKISYPAADSTRIFDFIGEVQSQAVNNALVPFADFEAIQKYLRQQWAGMLYRFLTSESEASRVADILSELAKANEKIEFLARQVVASVADPVTKLKVELYDYLLPRSVVHDLTLWGLTVTPDRFLVSETLDDFCDNQIRVDPDSYSDNSLTYGGPPYKLGANRLEGNKKEYKRIHSHLLQRLRDSKVTVEQFLASSAGDKEASIPTKASSRRPKGRA